MQHEMRRGSLTCDVISFNAAISATRQWQRAALQHEMRRASWTRNVISFNAAISAKRQWY
eukprot:1068737-Karenia_brevis.AAC.1